MSLFAIAFLTIAIANRGYSVEVLTSAVVSNCVSKGAVQLGYLATKLV